MSDYIHVEVEQAQSSKKTGMPCGDVVRFRRSNYGTNLVCADGLGSGMRAHISAEMCVARLFASIEQGISFRKAFSAVAAQMEKSRDPKKPFAAFSILRIRPDGNATILSYDAPPPILVGPNEASVLANRIFPLPGGLAIESNCQLQCGEGILLMSDGITQAGIGYGPNTEWTSEGVVRSINDLLNKRVKFSQLPHRIHQESIQRWNGLTDRTQPAVPAGNAASRKFSPYAKDAAHTATEPYKHKVVGDDCTAVLAYCRTGQTVNILTGPPVDKEQDTVVVRKFLETPGLKIVCGGTTARLVSQYMGVPLEMEQEPMSVIAPPRYGIRGINLVTEGAVTLNQVYNILDEEISKLNDDSGVTELRLLLNVADRVNFVVGSAKNKANDDISFLQRGVLSRKVLIPLLADKLEKEGKLVNVRYV